MNNYSEINKEIIQTNNKLNNLRNPDASFSNIIRIEPEINVQGKIPLIYTYNINNTIKHDAYSFTKEQLKSFILKHRDALVTFDGINPIDINKSVGVKIDTSEINVNENVQSTFQPANSFQTSFNTKYNNSDYLDYHPPVINNIANINNIDNTIQRSTIQRNSIQSNSIQSNISGNDVYFNKTDNCSKVGS